ncbi:MAG: 2-amino-4-hydroxy-6-hydroxymethyldihydropteridine diphosphokinase [Gammaproteobacteria bacterium]|nr:2-amino-4-hydroxy-6-hydroxymethyldihydropteridine diphosphokinase [Gammaproteobacteria bacterium]
MARVSVSLGSNIDRERNIRRAIASLRERYGELILSPVYQTAAVGFSGDDFLNLVVAFATDEDVHAVVENLKAIEQIMGRDKNQPKFSARKIDLDLLTYDDLVLEEGAVEVPRGEILHYAFVLKPLSDIFGDQVHPLLDKTYRELWLEMQAEAGRIEEIKLEL